jgi:uncharacterized Ntn-hydrolase superfamily protein
VTEVVATYSIVACDLDRAQWGVATQSKFLAVGSVVPWAEARVGAVATQSYANPQYGPDGLALLRQGLPAQEVVNRLTEADTVDALAETFEASAARPLAERLLDCLDAAQAAGGDKRGQQSAALLVVEKDAGYAGLSDVVVELRVDDHERPLEELRRIYRLHDALFGRTPKDEWVDLDEELRSELTERLAKLGYSGELEQALSDWAGTENYEMRVEGVERVDPVVLDALRRTS